MKFFIPKAKDSKHAQEIYNKAKKFCEYQNGWKIRDTKIYVLRYRHNGLEHIAQVGTLDYTNGLVVCIFESEVTYLVCTPYRGVVKGHPMLVGRNEVSDIEYFDDE